MNFSSEPERRTRWGRSALAPWFVTLVISGLLLLPVELDRHKVGHNTLGGKIAGGIIVWVGIAAIFRFVVYLVDHVRGSVK